ncbi:Condensation domain-containing protein, partial [Chitinophaga eiseniae]
MEAFFSLLREHNIYISIADGNLSVKYPKGNIDKELLAEIKARKEDIISYLNQVTTRQLQIPLVQGQSGYELSSAQERLYVLSQLENNTVPYNMYGAYIFEGRLDTSVFSRAFQALITRHEILRTVFREDEQGEIRQFIRSGGASGFDIAFHDMQHAPQQVAILIEQNIAAPFALNEGPLLRVALCQIAVDKWVFSYVMHHIISDGWSMGVFFNDLLRLYNGFTGGGEALPPLRIQYKDYASWQRSRLTGTGTGKAYWQEVF